MRRIITALALSTVAIPALAGVDVGVSINVGQPGFYGQIDIGNTRPVVIQPEPIIIQPAARGVVVQPLYLYVPPGHRQHWKQYCGQYYACGRPVYFVQERWYNNVYVPYYRERHGGGGNDRGYRGDDRGDRGGHREGRGNHGGGHGHGRGN